MNDNGACQSHTQHRFMLSGGYELDEPSVHSKDGDSKYSNRLELPPRLEWNDLPASFRRPNSETFFKHTVKLFPFIDAATDVTSCDDDNDDDDNDVASDSDIISSNDESMVSTNDEDVFLERQQMVCDSVSAKNAVSIANSFQPIVGRRKDEWFEKPFDKIIPQRKAHFPLYAPVPKIVLDRSALFEKPLRQISSQSHQSKKSRNEDDDDDDDFALQQQKDGRLVFRSGICNMSHANISHRKRRYFADIYTTLVDVKWSWNIVIFSLLTFLSWLLFAFIYWIICFSHKDFAMYNKNEEWYPCLGEVYDFTTSLLFSIETQQGIGFGYRYPTPYCSSIIFTFMFQACFGVIVQALLTGVMFAKLHRAKKRADTIMFSRHAVVCQRDGDLCILLRIGDMRKSHIIQARAKCYLVRRRETKEGEVLPLYQTPISLTTGTIPDGKMLLAWPLILEHRIDESSPFWYMNAEDFRRQRFELIVLLEGVAESTGISVQARVSYLPEEIIWGHRFKRLLNINKQNGTLGVDYSLFNATYPVKTPTCSASELYARRLRHSIVSNDGAITDDMDEFFSDETDDRKRDIVNQRRPSTPSCLEPLFSSQIW